METTVIVAIISATALILVQIVGHYFSRWKESEADWRKNKFEQYRQFLTALSSIVGSDSTPEGHREFAMACNTLHLIASERAIKALNKFRDELAISNSRNRRSEEHTSELPSLIRNSYAVF